MPLGQLLGALGRFLAGLGRFLNAFLLPGIPRASILEGLGAGRAWFWKASGAYFGMRFAAPRTLKPNAFIHAVTTFFRLQALCSLSLPVRRSVRSTSAASRRDAKRAKFKVQVPNLALKAFLNRKRLALKVYLKVRLESQA